MTAKLRWRALLIHPRPSRRKSAVLCFSLLVGLIMTAQRPGTAQSQPSRPDAAQSATNPAAAPGIQDPEEVVDAASQQADVVIDGRTILSVYESIGSFTARDRAEKITERILAAAQQGVSPDTVQLKSRPMWTEISADGKLLVAVSDGDARAAGIHREQLAAEDAESIRHTLTNYRREHSVRAILRGFLYAAFATIALLPIAFVVRRLRLLTRGHLEKWIERRAKRQQKKTALHVAANYLISTFLALESVLRWLVLIALLEIYITVVLSFFPQTRAVSHAVTGWIFDTLRSMGRSVIAYVPNIFVIAVVVIVASQVSRLISLFFDEITKGNLTIGGFYPEWAAPSAKLIRMMVLVLVIIVVFPYLPGSKSPAFQGISIFVGVLLSLGSSSAVANAIAGVILTYMRSFAVGDWVKIGDTLGEVQERSMLVTRILTQKNESIAIPNATVMSGSVMNFSREATHGGVIFHTTVTIGYEAPWKTVHELLIRSAMATDGVSHDPKPFVLQTQLNDFYVSYELNAYTAVPRRMQFIYSDLHQNIQDSFNEAGVEICSPHFASLRDGNSIAIPEQYVARDYTAPGFRVDLQQQEARETAASRK